MRELCLGSFFFHTVIEHRNIGSGRCLVRKDGVWWRERGALVVHWPRVDARRLYDRYVIHALTHARNLLLRKRVNVCMRSKRKRRRSTVTPACTAVEYDEIRTSGL